MKTLCLFLCLLISVAVPRAADETPWYAEEQPRFARGDLGRVVSGTIELWESQRPPTLKALAIRVGPEDNGPAATVLYDTELLRASAAIPRHSVMFNTWRDGLAGAGHRVGPPYLFTTRAEPGWAHNGEFSDPRPTPHGSLPRDWAHYRGLYRHGPRAVLAYDVGPVPILESPWVEFNGSVVAVSRTLEVAPATQPLAFKLFDAEARAWNTASSHGRNWIMAGDELVTAAAVIADGRTALEIVQRERGRAAAVIPARQRPTRVKVLSWAGPREDLAQFLALVQSTPAPEDIGRWTRPGPPVWREPIVTRGELGTDDGPYVVDTLTPPYDNRYNALMTFGGHDFFEDGDAAICTIHGDVWRVSGIDADLNRLTWERYATGLFQPLGLKIVDDTVYVLGRDQITRLHDSNADHQADFYENFNNDCAIGSNVHEFATSLETDPDGYFYYSKGSNGGQTRHDGSLVRISPDGQMFEIFATGFRWPNGAGAGPDGTITVADQQGEWVPSSRLDVIRQGGFYGFMPAHHRPTAPATYDGPLCWIPHSIDNSCGGQTWVTSKRWGPLEGHMLHLSYGKCALFLVLEQSVNGIRQGGVVPFDLKFDSGAMRARFRAADGQLYVSGLKGWQTSAARDGCFQRVRHTRKPLRVPVGLTVHRSGVRIRFPDTLDPELAEDPGSWAVAHWNYRWTKTYGSKDYKPSNPDETGHDTLDVASATLSPDQKTVFLKIPGIEPVMQMEIQYDLGIVDGKRYRGAIYNTIHALAPD